MRFRVSLRTSFVLVAVAAVGCLGLRTWYPKERERIDLIHTIQSHGGTVKTTYAIPPFVGQVTEITLPATKMSDHFIGVRRLDRFTYLQRLSVTNFVWLHNSVRRRQLPGTITFDFDEPSEVTNAIRFLCRNGI